MRRLLGLLVAIAPACSPASSGEHCPSSGTLQVNVTDTVSCNPVCDATVTAMPMGAGAAQTLAPQGPPTGCFYVGQVTPGQYTVSVTKPGYRSNMQTLTIHTDGCSIDSPTLSIDLTPTN